MIKKSIIRVTLFLVLFSSFAQSQTRDNEGNSWKAGVSRINITPKDPMLMAGFASRTRPSEGTLHDLWAKVLVIEDSKGKRAVMVSSDLLGFTKEISDNIRTKLKSRYGLNRDEVLLNSSHTHSAPVLKGALSDIYQADAEQIRKVGEYSGALEEMVVKLVGDGIKNIEPAKIFVQNGVTRFQVNRRNNNAALLTQLTELQGPNDYAVPVIKIVKADGTLKAVAFGYSCHPTVLSGYQWSGDYPGFTQIEIEKSHPGATALFFQSAGADQNPLPRNTVPLARQYGRELAAAVERVLEEDMKELNGSIVTTYSELDLPLQALPSDAELSKIAQTPGVPYQQRWAQRIMAERAAGKKHLQSYPYPVQVWSIGGQPVVTLGGELVVEYAIKTKQMLGENAFIFGYSNDVMSYIPSSTVLKQGGYEGELAHMVYGLPAKWEVGVESKILSEIYNLSVRAGLLKK